MAISRIVAAWLVLAGGLAFAREQAWTERAKVENGEGNLWLSSRWDPDNGVRLRLASTNDPATHVVFELSEDRARARMVPARAFDPVLRSSVQSQPSFLPEHAAEEVELCLKFRDEGWAVYVENRPVLACGRLLDSPLTVSQPATEIPEDADTFFQRTAPFQFADDFLVPEDQEEILTAWTTNSGAWNLHSVIDDAKERHLLGRRNARNKPIATRSPNFYSVSGAGTNALITTGYDLYDTYHFEAAVRADEGEMGVVFLLQENGACHGFTLSKSPARPYDADLTLWRGTSTDRGRRTPLAAVRTPLVTGQWIKLRVTTFLNRIHCYIGQTRVIDIATELPVGGRFGLLVTATHPVRFDDVRARSNEDLDFATIADLCRLAVHEKGGFLPVLTNSRLLSPTREPIVLSPRRVNHEQELFVGSTRQAGHVFSAQFSEVQPGESVGLLLGLTDTGGDYYRYTCERKQAANQYRLEHVTPATNMVLAAIELPASTSSSHAPLELMADGSDGHSLHLYRNGELVLVHHPETPLVGAAGLYVGHDTKTRISAIQARERRDNVFRNVYEKNRQFVSDPYMRHWSSPEGQWITLKDKTTWYKGDIFGRVGVHLPAIAGSELHLGVNEGETNGHVIVAATTNERVFKVVESGRTQTVANVPLLALAAAGTNTQSAAPTNRWYTLHCEDHWAWLTSGGKLLARHPLLGKLSGTRIRLAGFKTDDLTHSEVARYSVRDCLFTESLHDWSINGGRWEVINRFNCLLEWSHMNGESEHDMAALWSKYLLGGDFCIELYAGMKHGWYDRCGDINLTVMNSLNTPSEGYTVTCTGWDPNHSQLHTRLYVNGEPTAESDKYTIPRKRAGNQRKGYVPLIKSGRAVHGAWYYIKLRRIGKRLQYYFDNELVLEAEDPLGKAEGSCGIWTFMNSIMVARVKLAAESVKPRPVAFKRIPLDQLAVASPTRDQPEPIECGVANNGRPLDIFNPLHWSADADVGQLDLHWKLANDAAHAFSVSNFLGGGTMEVRCDLPPARMELLAGWTFEVKRTPGAQFNFHYSIGRRDEDGKYKAIERIFHHISGTELSTKRCRLSGRTAVPPVPNVKLDDPDGWTRVQVWVDASNEAARAKRNSLLVQLEGFGNLQPSYVRQGLKGNAPGESYAVRNFKEIHYGRPSLEPAPGVKVSSLRVLDSKPPHELLAQGSPAMVSKWLELNRGVAGIHEALLAGYHGGEAGETRFCWINLPPSSCDVSWSETVPETVTLRSQLPYPDPRLYRPSAKLNGATAQVMQQGPKVWTVPLPRPLDVGTNGTIQGHVSFAGYTQSVALATADRPLPQGPVLLELADLSPLVETFEKANLAPTIAVSASTHRLGVGDPAQGDYLAIRNNGAARRLKTTLRPSQRFDAPAYPVMQFRYRASTMAHVSLDVSQKTLVHVSEPSTGTRTREAPPFAYDGQWHTWQGLCIDAFKSGPVRSAAMQSKELTLGSYHVADQTGRESWMDLDDVVLGPAASTNHSLSPVPHYYDLDGVASVEWVLHEGPTTFEALEPDNRAALAWTATTNGTPFTPDVGAVTQGLSHIFLRATDTGGNTSRVADIPIFVDRTRPVVTCAFKQTDDKNCNGTVLTVSADTKGLTPLNLNELKLLWNGHAHQFSGPGSTFEHSPKKDMVTLNWPHIFRRALNRSSDGSTNTITVAGLSDGVGNTAPDISVQHVIDYASDSTPPTLLGARFSTNVHWSTLSRRWWSGTRMFGHRAAKVALQHDPEGRRCVRITPTDNAANVTVSLRGKDTWSISSHPCLALQVRCPTYVPDEKFNVDLAFKFKKLGRRTLSLTGVTEGEDRIKPKFTIPWASNTWQTVVLDMREVLADEVADKENIQCQVTALEIHIAQEKTRRSLDVHALYMFAPWNAEDEVTFSAFDASGMQPLEGDETSAKQSNWLSVIPAKLRDQLPDASGTDILLRDRAGNSSGPIWIPFAPRPSAEPTDNQVEEILEEVLESD